MAVRRLLACVALLLLGPAGAGAETVIDFGDCAWRWKVIPIGVQCMTLDCDDSEWAIGCAPFGKPWACSPPATMLSQPGVLIMRRHVFNPGGDVGANITVRTQGYAEIWVDGSQRSWGGPQSDCPQTVLTAGQVLHHGDNVVVVWSNHLAGTSTFGGWIDVQLTTDGVTPTLRTGWGKLKAIYR